MYAQSARANAFHLYLEPGADSAEIEHPLINGVPCATIYATRVIHAGDTTPMGSFDLQYRPDARRWTMVSTTVGLFPSAFNVVIDPAQVFDCQDRIFTDGFH